MAIITKELALEIAKKLKAEITTRKNKPHDIAVIYHRGKLVAHFGIRRGSRKDLSHDHIPSQIHLGPHDARLLGQCPMSRSDWLEKLISKGFI